MYRKLLGVGLLLAITLLVLAACGGGPEQADPHRLDARSSNA
jgi:hypothetical protein